jgi:hypothetical protein
MNDSDKLDAIFLAARNARQNVFPFAMSINITWTVGRIGSLYGYASPDVTVRFFKAYSNVTVPGLLFIDDIILGNLQQFTSGKGSISSPNDEGIQEECRFPGVDANIIKNPEIGERGDVGIDLDGTLSLGPQHRITVRATSSGAVPPGFVAGEKFTASILLKGVGIEAT